MAEARNIKVGVTADGLAALLREATELNRELDRAERPRKVRAASAALDASTGGLNRGTAGAGRTNQTRDFARQAQGLGGLVHLYATFAANIYTVTAAFNALSAAMDFTNMEKAADILSVRLGTGIRSLAKDMKALTDGAISMSDALSSASLGATAGLTTKQIRELTTVAKGASIALGRDMTDALNRVFRGTIKIEPELLDELGVMVKVDDANKSYARTLNKTISSLTDYERRQAFVNAVTEQGIKKYEELNDAAANPFSKLLSSLKDLGTETLQIVNSKFGLGAFVNLLSQSPTALILGVMALTGLIMKTAIPAIGEISAKWREMTKIALDANQASIANINNIQQAASVQKEAAKQATIAVVAAKAELDKDSKKRIVGGKEIYSKVTDYIWDKDKDPAILEKKKAEAIAAIEKAKKDINKKIGKLEDVTKDTRYAAAQETELKKLDSLRADAARLDSLQENLNRHSTSAATAAQAQRAVHEHDATLARLRNEGTALEHVTKKRQALSAAYNQTDLLGFTAGMKEMNSQVNALNLGGMESGLLKVRGALGVVTVGVSKLLGTFSIWAAGIAVVLPILQGLAGWMGLTTDHADKLNDALTSVSDNLKLHSEIQEKLKSSASLADTYQLQAAAANAYADSLQKIDKASKELNAYKDAGPLTKSWEAMKFMATGGNWGAMGLDNTKLPLLEFDTKMEQDKAFKAKNANLLGGETAANAFTSAGRSGGVPELLEKIFKALKDPELEKSARSYNEASNSMIANFKELDTITNEYTISITNQSKDLKALNAFNSSTVNVFKQLADPRGGVANVSQYLKGITSQFQEMSSVSLPSTLVKLSTGLQRVEDDANRIYQVQKDLAAGDVDKLKQAEAQRTRNIEVGSQAQITAAGGIGAVQREFIDYNLKATEALAKLATAATDSAIIQAKVARNLKTSQLLTSFSGSNTALMYRREQEADKKRVDAENAAQRTNIKELKASKSGTEGIFNTLVEQITTRLGIGSGMNVAIDRATTPSGKIQELAKRDITPAEMGNLLNTAGQLQNLNAALSIATSKITLNNLSLDEGIQTAINKVVKTASDLASDTIAIEQNRLDKKLVGLEHTLDSNSTLNSEELDSRNRYNVALAKAQSNEFTARTKLIEAQTKFVKVPTKFGPDPTTWTPEQVAANKDLSIQATAARIAAEKATSDTRLIEEAEVARIEAARLTSIQSAVNLLEEQNTLLSDYSSLVLSVSQNYNLLNNITSTSISNVMSQVLLEEELYRKQVDRLQEALKLNNTTSGQIEYASKLAKLESDALESKIKKVKQLSTLYAQQNSLVLKTAEQKGIKETFTPENLAVAGSVMADRISESIGKSEAWLHQLSTGIVDSVVTIVDNFTTMIQKLSEERFHWRTFIEMVRNTFSDMVRSIASDMIKNAMLSFIKQGLEKIKPGLGKSSEEKAADTLNLKLTSNSDKLSELSGTIKNLITLLSTQKAAHIEERDLSGIPRIGDAKPTVPAETFPYRVDITTKDPKGNIVPEPTPSITPQPEVGGHLLAQAEATKVADLGKAATKINSAATTDSTTTKTFAQTVTDMGISTNVFSGAVGGLVGALLTGGSMKGALAGIATGVATNMITSGAMKAFGFANGGIMSSKGAVPLHKYATGGIASSPQLALFGEGRQNEAFVPLPDNRSIPVTLNGSTGGSMVVGDTNVYVTISNSGEGSSSKIDVKQAKEFSSSMTAAIKNVVQEELIKQSKPNGMLYARR
jgi:hypothetical protein